MISLVILILYYNQLIYVFTKSSNTLTQLDIRSVSWLIGYLIISSNIFAGVGLGHSPFYAENFLNIIFNDSTYSLSSKVYNHILLTATYGRYPPMNTYIQWVSELGIIGLILLLYFIFVSIQYGRKSKYINKYSYLIKTGLGSTLFTILIAINATPDCFYIGHINFIYAMYIVGIKLNNKQTSVNNIFT